jgi:hypothetical protein
MSKVYKPGERRKSLSECGCAAQCAEGGGDELCGVWHFLGNEEGKRHNYQQIKLVEELLYMTSSV